jgi:membrane protease YdiL (CAAX protease family)
MPADEQIPLPIPQPLPALPPPVHRIAPIWHTVVLVAAILAFSFWGAARTGGLGDEPMAALHGTRILHYALSGVFELLVVAWVALGLRLNKVPFRSIFGRMPRGLNDITREAGIAALFWLLSMGVLASVALTWNIVQTQVYQHQAKSHATPQGTAQESPQQQQIKMARKLMSLAPADGLEIAAWGVLCLIVGFSEEIIFRGYLQSQGIGLLHSTVMGVLFSALVFGAAHGYQGMRGVCLISVYGALFSGITLLRRNLLPGMIAHSWHDFFTGMVLALIRETHLLDRIPLPS